MNFMLTPIYVETGGSTTTIEIVETLELMMFFLTLSNLPPFLYKWSDEVFEFGGQLWKKLCFCCYSMLI